MYTICPLTEVDDSSVGVEEIAAGAGAGIVEVTTIVVGTVVAAADVKTVVGGITTVVIC